MYFVILLFYHLSYRKTMTRFHKSMHNFGIYKGSALSLNAAADCVPVTDPQCFCFCFEKDADFRNVVFAAGEIRKYVLL